MKLLLCACLLSRLVIFSVFARQLCPLCKPNQTPLSGHGAALDGSGRRLINVTIDSSWDDSPGQTNVNVFNGVNTAIAMWNAQVTCYYLALDHISGATDIKIFKAPSADIGGGCGDATPLTPYRIRLADTISGDTAAHIGALAAHEIGHVFGLQNESTCTSIMNGHTGACLQTTQSIKPRDAEKTVEHCLDDKRPYCNSNYYTCNNGSCTQDVNGTYKTLSECQSACTTQGGCTGPGCLIPVMRKSAGGHGMFS